MKRPLFQLFNLLMACIVLLSSTGFGLIEHTCLMRGKKVSMAINRDAQQSCPIHSKKASASSHTLTQTPVIKRTDCCKEQQRYENVDFSSSITQLVAKFIKSLADVAIGGIAALVSWLLTPLIAADTTSHLAGLESPPLHYGRSLLSFVQSFLL
ncbi:hypothetical protein GCM10028803_17500 [Larkinella knui]|uniref:Uncharacterized protein n=1 Tax=Larkinella knui TaxID=2025310 RepID=A0A3P1CU75_9BACT|nr:hypothetical protein [Larkinella knui]RRB16862.1 hypothetical protein EHT87_00805 [Larkinella knui]